jgi:hypothetical protein
MELPLEDGHVVVHFTAEVLEVLREAAQLIGIYNRLGHDTPPGEPSCGTCQDSLLYQRRVGL